ncbi:MAG: GCN5-related N-acetyltransferase [Frankiales bacterium]|nr:GCN5-related N-acetyltransferase [Frankiales bacterium]
MDLPCVPVLPVTTDRLVLRAFRPDDVDGLLPMHSDPESVRYVPYGVRDREAVEQVLQRKVASDGLRADGDLLELAVDLAADGTLVGDLLVALRSAADGTVEVGYLFSRAHQGRGYATEAVRALVDLCVDGLGARRVVARVDARNTRSRALLTRLGFRQEALLVENAVFKGELSSEADYAVLAREWRA